MNQIGRPLAWLRDTFRLTENTLPGELDTSGGVKPVVNVLGNGEPLAYWRSLSSVIPAATPAGAYTLAGLPGPPTAGFLPSQEYGDFQCVIAAMHVVNAGATAKQIRLHMSAPNGAMDVELAKIALPTAGWYSMVQWFGSYRRIVIPPFCGLRIELDANMPAAESVTIKYIYNFIPNGIPVTI